MTAGEIIAALSIISPDTKVVFQTSEGPKVVQHISPKEVYGVGSRESNWPYFENYSSSAYNVPQTVIYLR